MEVFGAPSDDYKTWRQDDKRWSKKPLGKYSNIGLSGCFLTSVCMLVAYATPSKQDSSKWNPGIGSGNGGNTPIQNGNSTCIANVNKVEKTMHCKENMHHVYTTGMTEEEITQKIIKFYNKGWYIIIHCSTIPITATGNGHFSPIVGVKNGKPVVWDVAHGTEKGHRYKDWSSHRIDRLDFMYSDLTRSCDVMDGTTSSTGAAGAEDKKVDKSIVANSIPNEDDLVGMPEKSKLNLLKDLELPDVSELQTVDTENIAAIKQGIEQGKKSPADYANTAISLIGILLMFYSLLMMLAYFFDYANVFVEISLLGVISFGRFRLLDEEDKLNGVQTGYSSIDGYSYLTRGMIFTRIALLMVVGLMLVSGLLQRLLLSAIYFVWDLVDRFINPV